MLGTLYGCKVAESYKVKNIYNISGHGSNGYSTEGFPVYGLCKAAIQQFTNTNSKNNTHTIAPGIMRTGLTQKLLDHNKFLDMFAKDPKEVAKIIVPKIIGISGSNQILRV